MPDLIIIQRYVSIPLLTVKFVKWHQQSSGLFSSHIAELLSESAHLCMGTLCNKNNSGNSSRLAILCIGICDECAEAYEAIDDKKFNQCAKACRYCSDTISKLPVSL